MLSWLRTKFGQGVVESTPGEVTPLDAMPPVEEQYPETKAKPSGAFTTTAVHENKQRLREYIAANMIPKKPKFVSETGTAMDAAYATPTNAFSPHGTIVPDVPFAWYVSQGFIGYQACAVISQHWLVSKACNMTGKDAAQGGWSVCRDDGEEMTPEQLKLLETLDRKYRVKQNLVEASYYRNVFGIRLVWFQFEGMDYSKPFNPASVVPGSYRGMSQVDPYWVAPFLTPKAIENPGSKDFYVPEFWQINRQKVHKSHLVILYGQPVPDILKPTYMYGGVPLTQRIYERVYSAERTANEAPQLAQTKRLTVRYTDLMTAMEDQQAFEEAIAFGAQYQDNYGVLVAGLEEKVERHETSLNDLDEAIMTQYQLVAAIAETPATKILGTSPKGFGASGDYEIKNYHEKLRDIQQHDYAPILERHYQALALSDISDRPRMDVVFTIHWEPLDKPSAKDLADMNKVKADTDAVLQGAGAIDGYDIRKRLIEDQDSGYTGMELEEPLPEEPLPEEPISGEESAADPQTTEVGGGQNQERPDNDQGRTPSNPGGSGGAIQQSSSGPDGKDDERRTGPDQGPVRQ